MKKARLAIIGCGNFAENIHLPALRAIKQKYNNFELVAVCDLDIKKAEYFASTWPNCHCYDNVTQMTSSERLDGIMLYTGENATCAVAKQVLSAKIPCMLEKPPGKTAAETKAIIAEMDSSGVFALAAFNRRYAPVMMKAKALWDERTGDRIDFVGCDFYRHNRINEDFSTCIIHGIDAVSFLAGSLYLETALQYQGTSEYTNIFIKGVHHNGAASQINCLPATGMQIEHYIIASKNFAMRIFFNGGRHETGIIFYSHGKEMDRIDMRSISDSELLVEGGFIEENLNFIETLLHIRPINLKSMNDSLNAVEISEAIRLHKSVVLL